MASRVVSAVKAEAEAAMAAKKALVMAAFLVRAALPVARAAAAPTEAIPGVALRAEARAEA